MAKYFGTDGKKHKINIAPENWEYHGRNNDRIEFVTSTGSYLWIRVAYDNLDIFALNPIIPEYAEYRENDCEKVTVKLSKTEREYFRLFLIAFSSKSSDIKTENPVFELHSKTFYRNKMGRAVVLMNRNYHAARIDFIFKVHKNKAWSFWYENGTCLTCEEKKDLENWFVKKVVKI